MPGTPFAAIDPELAGWLGERVKDLSYGPFPRPATVSAGVQAQALGAPAAPASPAAYASAPVAPPRGEDESWQQALDELKVDPEGFNRRRVAASFGQPETNYQREPAVASSSTGSVELILPGGRRVQYAGGQDRLAPDERGLFGAGSLQENQPFGEEPVRYDAADPGAAWAYGRDVRQEPARQISREGLAGEQSGVSMMPGLEDWQRRDRLERAAEAAALAQMEHDRVRALLTPEQEMELERQKYAPRQEMGDRYFLYQEAQRLSEQIRGFRQTRTAEVVDAFTKANGRAPTADEIRGIRERVETEPELADLKTMRTAALGGDIYG